MGAFIDMTGKKCGRLTVRNKLDERDPLGNVLWRCVCDCGNEHVTNGIGLRHGRVKSCGCLQKEAARSNPITQPESLEERLKRNTSRGAPDECWPWTGATNKQGYAPMRFRGVGTYAHRLAYELAYGKIPDGLHILHKCDNPRCVNPRHLTPGTHQKNMDDMWNKGRGKILRGPLNGHAKLTNAQAAEIRKLATSVSCTKLAAQFGVCKKTILKIKHGVSYVTAPRAL